MLRPVARRGKPSLRLNIFKAKRLHQVKKKIVKHKSIMVSSEKTARIIFPEISAHMYIVSFFIRFMNY